MDCREFREISEAYLSDELLVETNLQVFRHLENCPNCRKEFAAKRELRERLRTAAKNGSEFQIDPDFAKRLRADLKETMLPETRKSIFSAVFLIPAMAALILTVGIGFIGLKWKSGTDLGFTPSSNSNLLSKISLTAVGTHEECALEKLQEWEEESTANYPEKAIYQEKVIKPLQAKFSEDVEMIHAHDCVHDGKFFTHIILRKGTKIISVLFDKTDVIPQASPELGKELNAKIISEKEKGLQVASFAKTGRAFFVISDLSEAENLNIARTLSEFSTGQLS